MECLECHGLSIEQFEDMKQACKAADTLVKEQRVAVEGIAADHPTRSTRTNRYRTSLGT